MKITAVESLYWQAYPRLLTVRIHADRGSLDADQVGWWGLGHTPPEQRR